MEAILKETTEWRARPRPTEFRAEILHGDWTSWKPGHISLPRKQNEANWPHTAVCHGQGRASSFQRSREDTFLTSKVGEDSHWRGCLAEVSQRAEGRRTLHQRDQRNKRCASFYRAPTCHRPVSLAQSEAQPPCQEKKKSPFSRSFTPMETVFPEAQAPWVLGSKINGKSFPSIPKSCPRSSSCQFWSQLPKGRKLHSNA